MDETSWTYESKYTILKASPELRERFRAAMRAQIEEDEVRSPSEEELEEMAAFAWFIRAQEVCAKTDVLLEEGVPADEVRRIAKVEPPTERSAHGPRSERLAPPYNPLPGPGPNAGDLASLLPDTIFCGRR